MPFCKCLPLSVLRLIYVPFRTVRTHEATHMPLPPDSCGHSASNPPGGDPGTNGLLTGNRSNCGHRCSNPRTTPVVSKSAKVQAAYTSLPPGLTAAAACRSIRCCNLAELLHVLRGRGPPRVRVSVPGPNPAARRVHQHPVELRFRWESRAAVPTHRAIIENPGPRRPPFKLCHTPCGAIARPDQSLVPHQIRKVQRLAAFSRARIPPCFAR